VPPSPFAHTAPLAGPPPPPLVRRLAAYAISSSPPTASCSSAPCCRGPQSSFLGRASTSFAFAPSWPSPPHVAGAARARSRRGPSAARGLLPPWSRLGNEQGAAGKAALLQLRPGETALESGIHGRSQSDSRVKLFSWTVWHSFTQNRL
jgi:hypothetical protein